MTDCRRNQDARNARLAERNRDYLPYLDRGVIQRRTTEVPSGGRFPPDGQGDRRQTGPTGGCAHICVGSSMSMSRSRCMASVATLFIMSLESACRSSTMSGTSVSEVTIPVTAGLLQSTQERPNRSLPRQSDGRGRLRRSPVENVGANAVRNTCRRRLDRIAAQMRVARGRIDLVVTEELADHAQALAER